MPKTYRFNHVVGVDLVELKNLTGKREFWLNVICWGTVFQLVGRVGEFKTPEAVWACFVHTWVRIFGMPEIIVCDPGTEFQSYFTEQVGSRGIAFFPTDSRAPWQNGRTEREPAKNGRDKSNLLGEKNADEEPAAELGRTTRR